MSDVEFKINDDISRLKVKPVILLGAPRSGTQMYRDMICSHPKISTWPYNDMSYMWRYGNRSSPTDELSVSNLTPEIARYIRSSFIKLSRRTNSPIIVDKTCNNCLSPEFVSKVLPEAKYIYLVRNAMDVIPSVVKRASSAPPLKEYKKVFSIPSSDIFHYLKEVAWNHGGLLRPTNSGVRTWGPKFAGMEELTKTKTREEVSAYQWLRIMEKTDGFLNSREFSNPLLRIRYEEVTKSPEPALRTVFDFLGVDTPVSVLEKWKQKVVYREPGSSARSLGDLEDAVRAIVGKKNAQNGHF